MKAGIIGFPLVGKTTLFKILTKAWIDPLKSEFREDSHIGVATVPDERLEKLSTLFDPKKITHATVEYIDVAGLSKGESKNAIQLGQLRNVDALVNVVRVFEDDSIPRSEGQIDPKRDIGTLELELILADLSVTDKRLERLEKDIKKQKNPLLEKEVELLGRCKTWLEQERPLRALELDVNDKKILRGFMFLSEKPVVHVLNLSDSDAGRIDKVISSSGLDEIHSKPNEAITAVCGRVEAELVELPGQDAHLFLGEYGFKEWGLERLIRVTYQLLGLISFFTVGEDECRAWTIKLGTSALKAAGVIHSDIERCFVRAEVIPFDKLLELKSLSAARGKGLLRLEGKEYVVQEGDVINFRHTA